MGCNFVKQNKVEPQKRKVVVHSPSEDVEIRQFSLYTVKEEGSDMEQSYAGSKRQSLFMQTELLSAGKH